MVTKQPLNYKDEYESSVLAKILMVTKHPLNYKDEYESSVLAKILMVTKPQKYGSTFLNVIEY